MYQKSVLLNGSLGLSNAILVFVEETTILFNVDNGVCFVVLSNILLLTSNKEIAAIEIREKKNLPHFTDFSKGNFMICVRRKTKTETRKLQIILRKIIIFGIDFRNQRIL